MQISSHKLRTHTYMHLPAHEFTYTYIHARKHAEIHVRMHTCKKIHICIHACTLKAVLTKILVWTSIWTKQWALRVAVLLVYLWCIVGMTRVTFVLKHSILNFLCHDSVKLFVNVFMSVCACMCCVSGHVLVCVQCILKKKPKHAIKWMFEHVCACICMYVRVCVRICMYVCIWACGCMCMSMCWYVCNAHSKKNHSTR